MGYRTIFNFQVHHIEELEPIDFAIPNLLKVVLPTKETAMTAKTVPEMLQALEDSEEDSNPPIPSKELLNPIVDRLKQSSFQPDIQSYVTLDAKVYEDKSYWLEMHAKYYDSELEIWIHRHHGELDEAMKFLKSLNQLTGDMMEFMKRHNLRSPIEVV